MARIFAKLQRIEHNEPITMEKNYEFLYQLQHALLLALREQGRLSPMQHRHAEECLRKQRRERARRKREEP
ncbi:MAG: hypothetical protein IJB59_02000 [Oscillospiraceae bacterium]|nr:hypothetical protein [Oscillospiraceae bacterium]